MSAGLEICKSFPIGSRTRNTKHQVAPSLARYRT